MFVRFAAGGFVGFWLTYMLVLQPDLRDRDMKVCQLSHSHDVCFQALNR